MTNPTAPVRFYFHPTPNPMKVALMLEELGAPYEIELVDVFKGEQHAPAFLRVNPNAKVPALDDDGVTVFDSHAILLHLAEKHGRFLPKSGQPRASALSWLQFIATGLSPFSGQAAHFLHYAPEKIAYATRRYVKEVERHYAVLDRRLADARWLAGDEYSIADVALWGWTRSAGFVFGEAGLTAYPHVKRTFEAIDARPAAQRAVALRDKVTIKTTFDAEAKKAMFPHMEE